MAKSLYEMTQELKSRLPDGQIVFQRDNVEGVYRLGIYSAASGIVCQVPLKGSTPGDSEEAFDEAMKLLPEAA